MIKIDPLKEGGGTAEEKEERKRGEGREREEREKRGERRNGEQKGDGIEEREREKKQGMTAYDFPQLIRAASVLAACQQPSSCRYPGLQ